MIIIRSGNEASFEPGQREKKLESLIFAGKKFSQSFRRKLAKLKRFKSKKCFETFEMSQKTCETESKEIKL